TSEQAHSSPSGRALPRWATFPGERGREAGPASPAGGEGKWGHLPQQVGKVRVSAYPLIDADEAALLVLEHTPVLGTERVQLAGVVPDGAACGGMVEHVRISGEQVTVPPSLVAGNNFHKVGDDVQSGVRILSAGSQLGAAEIGIAAATGHAQVPVRKRPRVAL